VQHVVADLHVLQDLGDGQHRGAGKPGRRQEGGEQQDPATYLQLTLDGDDPADIPRVVLAAAGDHLVADLVKLAAELIDVGPGQMRSPRVCRRRHSGHPSIDETFGPRLGLSTWTMPLPDGTGRSSHPADPSRKQFYLPLRNRRKPAVGFRPGEVCR